MHLHISVILAGSQFSKVTYFSYIVYTFQLSDYLAEIIHWVQLL
jgi:hypothetical protein